MALKLRHFGKEIRNNWNALKCGAEEGWRRSFGANVRENKKCFIEPSRTGTSNIQ